MMHFLPDQKMKFVLLILVVYFVASRIDCSFYGLTSKAQSNFKRLTTVRCIHSQSNKRRFCAPITIYANHSATFQLIISGDIETNPGPTIRVVCPVCQKTVRKNSYRLECKVCLNITHVKCILRTLKKLC